MLETSWTRRLVEPGVDDVPVAGGKNASPSGMTASSEASSQRGCGHDQGPRPLPGIDRAPGAAVNTNDG